jgi:hypothetical protein
MAKRKKQGKSADAKERGTGDSALTTHRPHEPKKQPALLALSVVLFVLWFVFLLVTALRA